VVLVEALVEILVVLVEILENVGEILGVLAALAGILMAVVVQLVAGVAFHVPAPTGVVTDELLHVVACQLLEAGFGFQNLSEVSKEAWWILSFVVCLSRS
jgi:hypothetical protein